MAAAAPVFDPEWSTVRSATPINDVGCNGRVTTPLQVQLQPQPQPQPRRQSRTGRVKTRERERRTSSTNLAGFDEDSFGTKRVLADAERRPSLLSSALSFGDIPVVIEEAPSRSSSPSRIMPKGGPVQGLNAPIASGKEEEDTRRDSALYDDSTTTTKAHNEHLAYDFGGEVRVF
jgi:hypothetical protein